MHNSSSKNIVSDFGLQQSFRNKVGHGDSFEDVANVTQFTAAQSTLR